MYYESQRCHGHFLPPTLIVICQALQKEHFSPANAEEMSHPNPEDPDYNWEQFGGGGYISPPAAQTPTHLCAHIKPTVHDSGLVKNAQGRRVKLVTNLLDESGEVNPSAQNVQPETGQLPTPILQQELPNNSTQGRQGLYGDVPCRAVLCELPHEPQQHPSHESQRYPSGPCEPPLPLNAQQPQPNIILLQPPLATMQGTHTPVGLNSGQDLHAAPLNAGLSADALGVLGLPQASPIDDFSAGTSTTFDGTHCPFTANTEFDFSSLDVPWDPTPPSFGAQPGMQDAFQSHDDMRESLAGALVGHRTDEVNVLLGENFKAINGIFNDLVAKTGLPLQQVSHAYHKAHGQIHSAFNHWNTYGHYLKVDTTAAKHGFEAVFIICRKVVNQDTSLGYIHETPGAESFWQTCCQADEDMMIGHLKAHVYNLTSLTVVEDIYPDGTLSINKDELQPKCKSAKVSADTPDAMKIDPDALEVSDSGDWQLQVDVLQCIKGGITVLFKELGGKLTVCSGNFPWKKLHSNLDRQGFIMEGYPEDILMPGETCSTNARSKGINNLNKREQIILAEALKSGTLVIKHGPTGPSHLQPSAVTTKVRKPNGSVPIAPPIVVKDDSPTSTIVRQKNLVISVDIPPACPFKVVMLPKSQVTPVDIPPAHPFKVVMLPKSKVTPAPSNVITLNESMKASSGSEGDNSEYHDLPQDDESDYEEELLSCKYKARTIGSTHRLKHHVPSSDVELIEQLQPKGKGKETVLQKERARVRYHELTSDSEEEKKEVHSKPGPKPKMVIPGLAAAAKQVAFYEGGMLHTYESSRAAGPLGAAEPSGASDMHESSRAVSTGVLPEPSAPSSAPSSPSPQCQQPPHSLVPLSYDQHSPALQTAPYNYSHGRTLPAPSYGQHLDVLQGQNYPDPHHDQITYQWTAQPLLTMNQSLGVNTASYSHAQYPPHDDVYTHLAPHHANAAHTEAYMTRPPAHQQHLENHGTPALVFSQQQQQQYSDVYGHVPAHAPAHAPSCTPSCTPSRAPTPQQHRETYDIHVPAHQPPTSQQHTGTYDTHVPAPQQGPVDGRVPYNLGKHWQPHYGPQTPCSSQRMRPLPALMGYSSSLPQSESN
ncbi:uncharacterized protein BJ212DRAFT_1302201 [Suillus subaureus]|uniref:Uncharacterized protein n=1 Tax=Suillus subaureus TaxID=48587 RepID=A0A9P7JAG5_9AGAM|nr:uncharacterized protein BJ212DRAFT_1302201 [Suillus subaureus]KAG1810874.1 hypothetical protein BJ212DRAFT_1302201 [Suillus subaureus]